MVHSRTPKKRPSKLPKPLTQSTRPRLTQVPPEVLLNVFKYLDVLPRCLLAQLVSKEWCSCLDRPSPAGALDLRPLGSEFCFEQMSTLCARHRYASGLYLPNGHMGRGDSWITMDTLRVLDQVGQLGMPSLSSLVLTGEAEYSFGTLGLFARALLQLEVLHSAKLSKPVVLSNPLGCVTRLVLSHSEELTDDVFIAIGNQLPQLQDLYTQPCNGSMVSDRGLHAVAHCGLRLLAVHSDRITDHGLNLLANSPSGASLQYLYMRGEQLTVSGLDGLASGCTGLRYTELPFTMLYMNTVDIFSLIMHASGHWGACECIAVEEIKRKCKGVEMVWV